MSFSFFDMPKHRLSRARRLSFCSNRRVVATCLSSAVLLSTGAVGRVAQAAPHNYVVTSKILQVSKSRSLGTKISTPLTLLSERYVAAKGLHAQGIDTTYSTSRMIASIGSPVKVSSDKVLVNVTTTGSSAAADLKSIGMQITGQYRSLVSGYLPIGSISKMAALKSVVLARPDYGYTTFTGSVESQGDRAQRSDTLRSSANVTGANEMVGVLSDSFDTGDGSYGEDQISGDLPSGIKVVEDSPDGTDEGRAMLQIVHDVAPDAKLAFATANGGEAAFANNIIRLKNAGCTVIVDDVMYFAEPMFMDGLTAQAASSVVQAGIPYFSAAGNEARQSYEGQFRDSGQTLDFEGTTEHLHDFDPGPGVDPFQSITIPAYGEVKMCFQWDDAFKSVAPASNGAKNDFDIFLLDSSNTTALAGGFDGNVGGDPVEFMEYFNETGAPLTCNLVIGRVSGTASPELKYVEFGQSVQNEYDLTRSTLYGHANGANVAAVGAAFWRQTPQFGDAVPELEEYSARGGTPILRNSSGIPMGSTIRQHPDFVAPDGGDTTFFGEQINDGDDFPNFFGTSAAAPHAAGVAALLLQAKPGLTPSRLITALRSTAIDMGVSGYDYETGGGLIDAVAALNSLAGADTDPPSVLSISRVGESPTAAASVQFTVTFSESVTGVDASDFVITKTGPLTGPTITNVSGSGSTYTVTVGNYTGTGTIRLDLKDDDSIVDGAKNPLGGINAGNGSFTSGDTFTIVVNVAPVLTKVTLSPSSPKTKDLLKAVPTGSDANGDNLTYTYTWTKTTGTTTTTLSTTTDTLDLSKSGNGDKGDIITVSVVASDGRLTSNALSATATIVNSAPVVTSVTFTPSVTNTNSVVKAIVAGHDDDGDALSYTYVWKKKVGDKTTTLPTTSNTLDLSVKGNGDLGDLISCTVTAHSGTSNSGLSNSIPVTASFTVSDTAPVITSVTLTPVNPSTKDKLKAVAKATDVDGGPITYSYSWKKVSGSVITPLSETSNVLDLSKAGNGDRGDVIVVTVVAIHGQASSAPATANTTVEDSAPLLGKVSLSPSKPFTNDVVKAKPTATDIDNDELSYTYVWTNNGKVIDGVTGDTLDLSVSGHGDAGQTIGVTVVASDGTLNSRSGSASVVVADSAPVVTVTLTPTNPTTNSVLTAKPSVSDADGNAPSLTYTYVWTRNGKVIAGETTSKLDLSKPDNGDANDTIGVQVNATGGSDFSTTAKAHVKIGSSSTTANNPSAGIS